jgi:hypothetical protein
MHHAPRKAALTAIMMLTVQIKDVLALHRVERCIAFQADLAKLPARMVGKHGSIPGLAIGT